MSSGNVTSLAITPIKGTRLRLVDSIELGPSGARGDRRFFLIDARERMVNSKKLGSLQTVETEFDPDTGLLGLTFPDRAPVQAAIVEGAEIEAGFYSTTLSGRIVEGPFSEALSALAGQQLRLVVTDSAIDRGERGAASLISQASLLRLAEQGEFGSLDPRRFRMLIEIDGLEAHAEDRWVGRSVKLGGAVVHFEGHVGRCLVTSRDPDTGTINLPTLDALRAYRSSETSTEPLPFGIYGRVLRPGRVAVGDSAKPI